MNIKTQRHESFANGVFLPFGPNGIGILPSEVLGSIFRSFKDVQKKKSRGALEVKLTRVCLSLDVV